VTNRRAEEFEPAAARDHGWQPVDSFERRIGISEAALQRLILRGFVIQRGARVSVAMIIFRKFRIRKLREWVPRTVLSFLAWRSRSRAGRHL
jgi:hypothetical protein